MANCVGCGTSHCVLILLRWLRGEAWRSQKIIPPKSREFLVNLPNLLAPGRTWPIISDSTAERLRAELWPLAAKRLSLGWSGNLKTLSASRWPGMELETCTGRLELQTFAGRLALQAGRPVLADFGCKAVLADWC